MSKFMCTMQYTFFKKNLQIHLNDHRDLNKHPLKLKANVRHLQALFDSTASFG